MTEAIRTALTDERIAQVAMSVGIADGIASPETESGRMLAAFARAIATLTAEMERPAPARKVYLVATGDIRTATGRELYERYDDAPPPLCDAEMLLSTPPAERPAPEPVAWQPMRTAPKDGTAVLLLLDASDIPHAARWLKPDDRRGSGFEGWHITWDGHRVMPHDGPRYWMPCPDDPDEAQDKDQT